jgi:hypothetical protein
MDSIASVYSDTRSEYTKQLCIFLVPAYFQFFVDLFTKAKQTSEPKKTLWQLQTYLNEVHEWNMEKVHNEIGVIHNNTGCDYLEDLLTAVFIAHTKVLTAIRLSINNKKIEITIPKVEHFLFKVLCEISKLLWSSTYLFRDDISGIDRQQNYKTIEGIISEGILQAVRSLVPVKSILKNLVNHDDKADKADKGDKADDDSDDDLQITKSTEPLLTPAALLLDSKESLEPLVSLDPLPALDSLKSLSDSLPAIEPLAAIPLVASVAPIAAVAAIAPIQSILKSDSPPIINLDEKPSVSFAKFNSLFSSEDPEESTMIDMGQESPDLDILDTVGSSLSNDDFDDLEEPSGLDEGDYDEL